MIQRIQSVYLFLTIIFSCLFLAGGFLIINGIEGSETIMKFSGVYLRSGDMEYNLTERMIPLTLISLLIPVISLITIFLFGKRNLQIKLTIILLVLETLLILTGAFYTVSMVQNHPSTLVPELKLFFPFLEIIFTFLAYSGIRKDEALIKSYDRLR